MDYGPFGFIEKYERAWNMWVGGGEHFSFMNQPAAGEQNFRTLSAALRPLLDAASAAEADEIVEGYAAEAQAAVAAVFRRKLGLARGGPQAEELWAQAERLMEATEADYTIFFRRLADARLLLGKQQQQQQVPVAAGGGEDAGLAAARPLLAPLREAFYTCLSPQAADEWARWLAKWAELQQAEGRAAADVAAEMNACNPKYVPREWMLRQAYTRAEAGDYAEVHALHQLLKRPYDEQPEMEARYFVRTPDDLRGLGGITCMTCSS